MLGKTPEVRLPGLDATGFVLLRLIGELVLSQGAQTLATGNDPSLTSAEKASPFDLIGRDGSGALVGVSGLDVNALAVRVGGFRYAVGSDDILATLVALPSADEAESLYPRKGKYAETVVWLAEQQKKGVDFYAASGYNWSKM